ncbi:MAG TPA: VOC family protein [Gillisia sp.]|nr:VOC family protein [Gillisia sp.]
MVTINPYLNFNGKTEEAFKFYQTVFGGELSEINRFKDMPDAQNIPEPDREKVMHVSLPIGKGNFLMGSDIMGSMASNFKPGNNFYISVSPQSREETERIFKELSKGGKIEMELDETFWGSYFGMFQDKYGINWMLDYAMQSH